MMLLIIQALSEQILNVTLFVIFFKWDIMFVRLQTTDLVLNPFVTHCDYAQQVYELLTYLQVYSCRPFLSHKTWFDTVGVVYSTSPTDP